MRSELLDMRDLGVLATKDLSPSTHINDVVSRAICVPCVYSSTVNSCYTVMYVLLL